MTTTEQVTQYLATSDARLHKLSDCADALNIPVTTLEGRLRREGAAWSDLRDNERRRRVRDLLARNPRADLRRIALVCGLGHWKSSSRTFKRLFGVCRMTGPVGIDVGLGFGSGEGGGA